MPGSGGGSWEGRAGLATGWGLRDPTPGRVPHPRRTASLGQVPHPGPDTPP